MPQPWQAVAQRFCSIPVCREIELTDKSEFFKKAISMDNLSIHFLNDDEQLATQEAVNKLVFNNTGANDEAQLEALAEHLGAMEWK